MDFETSTQDLVLQRQPSIVDDTLMSSFNSTFTLQEHCAEIIRYNNKEFYEQVCNYSSRFLEIACSIYWHRSANNAW